MAWQKKGKRMAMGKFVRAKSERMVLLKFEGEPKETMGTNFVGEEVEEMQFPVLFWEERSVGEKFKPGEAANMIATVPGENKIFPVQGGPLMRELTAEDEESPIIGRYFIISHTGSGRDTTYKLRDVKITRQAPVAQQADIEQDDEGEEYVQQVPPEEMEKQEKVRKQKFHDEVEKRAKKHKKVEPSDEPKTEQSTTEDVPS